MHRLRDLVGEVGIVADQQHDGDPERFADQFPEHLRIKGRCQAVANLRLSVDLTDHGADVEPGACDVGHDQVDAGQVQP
jgi:hypothetical protein